jgi:triosephosphate isomerase (TIM)
VTKLIVANWKMQKTYGESIAWAKAHKVDLVNLFSNTSLQLVLCPEFTALACIASMLKETGVKLGAQDCGFEQKGSFTGDVSPLSLKEIGCSYGIIGHSERRQYHCEYSQVIAKKAELLIANNITPILCIGETEQERKADQTIMALRAQLVPVLEIVKRSVSSLIVAYEPLWAIGTGNIPSAQDIENVSKELAKFMRAHYPSLTLDLLYGGSVNETSIKQLNTISSLKGFLIGKASTDFQELKKTVLLVEN